MTTDDRKQKLASNIEALKFELARKDERIAQLENGVDHLTAIALAKTPGEYAEAPLLPEDEIKLAELLAVWDACLHVPFEDASVFVCIHFIVQVLRRRMPRMDAESTTRVAN